MALCARPCRSARGSRHVPTHPRGAAASGGGEPRPHAAQPAPRGGESARPGAGTRAAAQAHGEEGRGRRGSPGRGGGARGEGGTYVLRGGSPASESGMHLYSKLSQSQRGMAIRRARGQPGVHGELQGKPGLHRETCHQKKKKILFLKIDASASLGKCPDIKSKLKSQAEDTAQG